jgi:rSAM/selenodomain-associated transferase 2
MIISVIIPVYSEENNINKAISALKDIGASPDNEIIVVDGGPGAATLKNIKDESIIKLVSAPGRAKQMNAGAAIAAREVLLFLHADTTLPAGAFEYIADALKDKNINAGAFRLSIDTSNIFLKFIEFTANVRTRLFRMPYGDQALFFRKEYFDALGRYKDIPLMEDVEIMRRIKKKGGAITIISKNAVTSARRWEKEGVLAGTLRNKILKLMYNLGVGPEKLARYYK